MARAGMTGEASADDSYDYLFKRELHALGRRRPFTPKLLRVRSQSSSSGTAAWARPTS